MLSATAPRSAAPAPSKRSLWRRAASALALLGLLAACDVAPLPDGAAPQAVEEAPIALPAMKRFGATSTSAPRRDNVALAQDYLDLTFEMESGRQLDLMTRFSEPVTIGVRGEAPPTLAQDLRALVARLRTEAGIDIRLAAPGADAAITVNVISRRELRRQQPDAACFILPNIATWEDFRRARRSPVLDWARLRERTRAAIFLPGDVPPQEIRDCLHEEVAQALGPLNDLYRLPDSIFNDDNFHRVLTGFDMLMLRIHYDPALSNGMSRDEVAQRLPAILNRLNPGGRGRGGGITPPTPRAYIDDIKRATGPSATGSARRSAAARAVALARAQGWQDSRTAYALYVQGRLNLQANPNLALASLLAAKQVYDQLPDTELQAAEISIHLAAFALSAGQADNALRLTREAIPPLRRAQNAGELATALMIRAEALELSGRMSEARATRLDSLGWARYGIGDGRALQVRLQDIASLNPARQDGS